MLACSACAFEQRLASYCANVKELPINWRMERAVFFQGTVGIQYRPSLFKNKKEVCKVIGDSPYDIDYTTGIAICQ